MEYTKYTYMKILLGALLFLTVVISCDDRLEVDPTQSIDQNQALSTEKDVLVTLIGAYDGLQEEETYGGDYMVMSELYGNNDDLFFTGTFEGLSDIWNTETVPTNENARATWIDSYIAINITNNVLSALDKVTSSEETRDRVEGEALFIRSSMYFELVRFYAKTWDDGDNTSNPGVPLVLDPTRNITEADYKARNSVAEVYAQIVGDLERAESLLPEENGIYATKAAAAAILSRVKLMQGATGATPQQQAALADARDAADRAIEYGTNSLADDFQSLWFTYINEQGTSPSEYIFAMQVTTQDGINALNTYFGNTIEEIPGTSGRGDMNVTEDHIARYETGDVRKDFFVEVGGQFFTMKHLDTYGNIPVVRLGEMYLTRAEANFRLGTTVGADPVDDLNMIRERAGLDPLASIASVDVVVEERYLELAFEGSRLHDLKRTRRNSGGVVWNDPKLILPIPQREIDTNKQLTQNDAYL
ncbi:MAG: RagB/SusD family nutrient uptake outer membrane protein [Chryseolinea sp.]